MIRGLRVVAVLVALALLGSCAQGSSGRAHHDVYVALGDSYVAGPGIGREDPVSSGCRRSERNYPSLVHEALDTEKFVDVSCGGATTGTVERGATAPAGLTIEPQLDAVSSEATLVTVGIGANDAGAAQGLFLACLLPQSATDDECRTFASAILPKINGPVLRRVQALLARIRHRAPHARVLLVGYLRIVPERGSCPALPISAANRASAEAVETAWNTMLRSAAGTARVTFVDVRKVARGHDACAGKEAWVNGARYVPGDGAFLHPKAAGMRNVAREVLKAVRAR